MNELIRIEDVEVQKLVYRDQPVLTLADIDRVHGRIDGIARKNFNNNRERFTFGKDFFDLPYEEWSVLSGNEIPVQGDAGGYRGNRIFMTRNGYLKLAKTLTDERAWKIHDVLVDSYFALETINKVAGLKYPQLHEDITEAAGNDRILISKARYISLLEMELRILKNTRTGRNQHGQPLSMDKRETIYHLHSQGFGYTRIARIVKCDRTTVRAILGRKG